MAHAQQHQPAAGGDAGPEEYQNVQSNTLRRQRSGAAAAAAAAAVPDPAAAAAATATAPAVPPVLAVNTSSSSSSSAPVVGSATGVLKEGLLTKEGGGIKTWRRRHFVLTPAALLYYRRAGDASPIDALPLAEYRACIVAPDRAAYRHVLALAPLAAGARTCGGRCLPHVWPCLARARPNRGCVSHAGTTCRPLTIWSGLRGCPPSTARFRPRGSATCASPPCRYCFSPSLSLECTCIAQ